MSRESHLGPTCGAVTAQKEKAGVGLLKWCARYLNMRYLSQYLDLKLQIDSACITILADDCIIYLKYIHSAIEVT